MPKPPIFIVGSSRSGTTLLAAMLNAHPSIACGPESQILNKIKPPTLARALADPQWPRLATKALAGILLAEGRVIDAFGIAESEIEAFLQTRPPGIAALFEAIPGQYALRQGKARWAEKTPRHLLHLDALRQAFPIAPIIRMVRDPRDSALSMRQLPWASDAYLANLYLWCEWFERSHPFFEHDALALTVIYEQLITDPQRELQRICQFVDEQFDAAMLDTAASGRSLTTPREVWKKQVSGPLDPSRLFRWKRELNSTEQLISSAVCEKWLVRFGYELDKRPLRKIAASGLDRRRIESNLSWLHQRSMQGVAYLPDTSDPGLPGLVHFVDDEELRDWRCWWRVASSMLSRRWHGDKNYLKYSEARPRYRLRLRLLQALAEPA